MVARELPPTFEARLAGARTLTPSVRELTFERLDGKPMSFVPGQWVNAFLPIAGAAGETPLKRSYSIASPPDGSPRFQLAVTRVQHGAASTWLHAAEPGTVLAFVGPHGFFTRAPSDAAPALMVATGTGLTPLRSMIGAALGAGSRATAWILLGVRHEADLLYADELRAIAASYPFVRFEPTLSQPEGVWTGRRGYVQTHVRDMWNELRTLGQGEPHAYVCGLDRMVSSVREMLRGELGVPRQQVHSERYD